MRIYSPEEIKSYKLYIRSNFGKMGVGEIAENLDLPAYKVYRLVADLGLDLQKLKCNMDKYTKDAFIRANYGKIPVKDIASHLAVSTERVYAHLRAVHMINPLNIMGKHRIEPDAKKLSFIRPKAEYSNPNYNL